MNVGPSATARVHVHDASPAGNPHRPQNKLLPRLGNHIAQAGGLDFKGPKSMGLRKQILPSPRGLTTVIRCSGPCTLILQVTSACNEGSARLYPNLCIRVLSQPGETNGPRGCLMVQVIEPSPAFLFDQLVLAPPLSPIPQSLLFPHLTNIE